jgi:hypothetical protein
VNKVNNFQILQSEQNRPKVNKNHRQSEQNFAPNLPVFEKLKNQSEQSEQTSVLIFIIVLL